MLLEQATAQLPQGIWQATGAMPQPPFISLCKCSHFFAFANHPTLFYSSPARKTRTGILDRSYLDISSRCASRSRYSRCANGMDEFFLEKQEIVEFWEFWERREICEFGWRTGHALSLHFGTNLLVIDGMDGNDAAFWKNGKNGKLIIEWMMTQMR